MLDTPGNKQADPSITRNELTLKFPDIKSTSGESVDSQPAIKALERISEIKIADQYSQDLQNLLYFRYLAAFAAWRSVITNNGDTLVKLLSDPVRSKQELYLKFLAIEQLQKSGDLKLLSVFASVLSQSTDPLTRAKIGDAAMYLVTNAWKNQVKGTDYSLNNEQIVKPMVDAFQELATGKKFDWLVANRLVIVLAALQIDERAIKWITDIVRLQCSRKEPLTEFAVRNSILILRFLNAKGSVPVIDYYSTILGQTCDPIKIKETGEKAAEVLDDSLVDLGEAGSVDFILPEKSAKPLKMTSKALFTYTTPGPLTIQAIGTMTIPESQDALLKLTRSRPDLLALIAVKIYFKDHRQGVNIFRQTFTESGRNQKLVEQSRLMMKFLSYLADPASLDLVVKVLPKTDSRTGLEAITMLQKINQNGKIPPDFDIKKVTRSIIQELTNEVRSRKDLTSVLTQAIAFGNTFSDPEITKAIDRAKKALEIAERQPTGSKIIRRR